MVDERETLKTTTAAKKEQKQKNPPPNKDKKEQGGTEAIVKGSELNDFVVHLS